MSEEQATVKVSQEVYRRLTEATKQSGAASVDELVGRIIRDWLTGAGVAGPADGRERMSAADEKQVEDRLRSLGYV